MTKKPKSPKPQADAAPAPEAAAAEPVQQLAVSDDDVNIDFRIVATDDVEPNDYNPNDMEAEFFEALVEATKQEGMNQPVLVRPNPDKPGKFLIVDGENRWRSVKFLNKARLPVVVVPYSEGMAKIRTLSYNNIRGQNIPIKLARLLVDLHKEFDPKTIRTMTGIGEDDQKSVMALLNVPDFNPSDGIRVSSQSMDRPIGVNIMLMPDENSAYTTAMKKAMVLAGDDVVALVGHEVQSYDKAMKGSMGIAGVKLRNVALALICEVFNGLPKETQDATVKKAHDLIYGKLANDAEKKEAKKEATDKKTPVKTKDAKGKKPDATAQAAA